MFGKILPDPPGRRGTESAVRCQHRASAGWEKAREHRRQPSTPELRERERPSSFRPASAFPRRRSRRSGRPAGMPTRCINSRTRPASTAIGATEITKEEGTVQHAVVYSTENCHTRPGSTRMHSTARNLPLPLHPGQPASDARPAAPTSPRNDPSDDVGVRGCAGAEESSAGGLAGRLWIRFDRRPHRPPRSSTRPAYPTVESEREGGR